MDAYYYGWGTQGFRQIMEQWAQYGFFDVLLPLILVFTIVFAILEKTELFKNRGVNIIIALVIGFFTVSNVYVSGFFMYLFSNLALGVAILLCLLILIGIAIKPEGESWMWIFGIAGGLLFLVVLGRSGAFKMMCAENCSFWFQQNIPWIIMLVFVALVIVGVAIAAKKEEHGFQVKPVKK